MQEQWKEIDGYKGDYLISSHGRVKSMKHGIEKLLRLSRDKNKYLIVGLSLESTVTQFKVHRLVAIHFIDKEIEKDIVNHKDGVKSNNNIDNLEWCSNIENVNHAIRTGLINNTGKKHYRFKGAIIGTEITTGKKVIMRGKKDIESYGFNGANVYACVNGKKERMYGYTFERECISNHDSDELNGVLKERL